MADFGRLENVLDQQTISRDPLSGVLDSQNLVFHSNYFPILTSGSLGVYVNGTLVSGTANYDTGEITLASPPTAQPFANYIFTPYSANQIAQFTIQGFSEMESRWTRGWQLLDASGQWADENSANVFIVDQNGNDPQCGPIPFSASRIQVAFFMICCEYRFMMTQYRSSARNDFMWREGVRGMMVDKSKRPQNIKLTADDLRDQLVTTMQQAQIQFYPGGQQFGAFIANPVTEYMATSFEWQTASIQNNNWALEGYNVSYRPLTYFP